MDDPSSLISHPFILSEPIVPGLRSVALNRPERRNALGIKLMEQLCSEIERLAAIPSERVIILRGEGPVFCSGLDLREAAEPALVEESAHWVGKTLQLLHGTPLIMICAVQGGAFAGGAGVMAACDFAIAAEDARFGFPEARRGLLPALITGVLRPKIREGDLRDLFLVGDTIDARRAQQIGLIQRVVSATRLWDEAVALGKQVLQGGPDTVRRTKQLLNDYGSGAMDVARLEEIHLSVRRSEEASEGLRAFAEKRDPNWIANSIN